MRANSHPAWLRRRGCRRGGGLMEVSNRGEPLVAQVAKQDVAQFGPRAPAQRLQDGLMFTHRFAPALPLAGKIGGIANSTNSAGEIGVGLTQRDVARRVDDLLM